MTEWPQWCVRKVPELANTQPKLSEDGRTYQWDSPRYAKSLTTFERLYLETDGRLVLYHGSTTSVHCIVAICTATSDWQLHHVFGSRWGLTLAIMTESITERYHITTFDSLDVEQFAAEQEREQRPC